MEASHKISKESDLRLAIYTSLAPQRIHTLEEIAEVMGCTRERVRQIEAEALKKLRFRIKVSLGKELTPAEIMQIVVAVHNQPEEEYALV